MNCRLDNDVDTCTEIHFDGQKYSGKGTEGVSRDLAMQEGCRIFVTTCMAPHFLRCSGWSILLPVDLGTHLQLHGRKFSHVVLDAREGWYHGWYDTLTFHVFVYRVHQS